MTNDTKESITMFSFLAIGIISSLFLYTITDSSTTYQLSSLDESRDYFNIGLDKIDGDEIYVFRIDDLGIRYAYNDKTMDGRTHHAQLVITDSDDTIPVAIVDGDMVKLIVPKNTVLIVVDYIGDVYSADPPDSIKDVPF